MGSGAEGRIVRIVWEEGFWRRYVYILLIGLRGRDVDEEIG